MVLYNVSKICLAEQETKHKKLKQSKTENMRHRYFFKYWCN